MARKCFPLNITRQNHLANATCPISELHVYRGHERPQPGFIMGHEFTGTVVAVGSAVKSVAIGDKVVTPFTASWYVAVS